MDPLDPRLVSELVERAKKQLRARMRSLRSALPASALAERSARIVSAVAELPAFREARSVGLFWPLLERHEVDVRGLDAIARSLSKRVYYPALAPGQNGSLRTEFRLTQSSDELAVRDHRFAEPPPEAAVAAREDIDLLLVPALAVALSGHRLGWGGGFYDATLPDFCPPARAVVVAFEFQLLAELPHLPHDVPCDFVVTDKRQVAAVRE